MTGGKVSFRPLSCHFERSEKSPSFCLFVIPSPLYCHFERSEKSPSLFAIHDTGDSSPAFGRLGMTEG
jgi:hypothetical protein